MSQLLDPPASAASVAAPANRVATEQPIDRLWTREEYHRLIEQNFFIDQRCELIQGRILYMSPQRPAHGSAVELADVYVRRAFPQGHRVRIQLPFTSADGSEPEPDIAVIEGADPRAASVEHPRHAVLIIEVSETTLSHDRRKARLYAASGVQEYWIVNLTNRTLEVHRDPLPNGGTPAGPAYASMRMLAVDQKVAPLLAPNAEVTVADLMP